MEKRLSKMLIQSRERSDTTQQHLARALHVSRGTIRNWESGYCSPSFLKVIKWFEACGEPIYPYMLKFLHPSQFEHLTHESEDEKITSSLHICIDELPMYKQRELLYILTGSHGSSPYGVIDMITAYLHTPLLRRINIARAIKENYEYAENLHELVKPNYVPPNMDLLEKCIQLGRAAALEHKNTYIQVERDATKKK